jgi:GT2 family glycosyltransferase
VNKIAVAIIFFEKLNQTIECIESVLNAGCNIYVLNNNSSPQTFACLKTRLSSHKQIRFIHSDENLGPARGRNVLIRSIDEEWILFLDNDITVRPDNWISILNNYIHETKDIEVFIPRLFNVHEDCFVDFHTFTLEGGAVLRTFAKDLSINWFPAGAACVNKSLFRRLGGYSEDLTALEDFEISIRGLSSGEPVRGLLLNEITLFHEHRYSRDERDQLAVRVRYKADQFVKAEEYIRNKYNTAFHLGWKPWVDRQLRLMTNGSGFTFLTRTLHTFLRRSKYKKR